MRAKDRGQKVNIEYRQEIEDCFKSLSGPVHGFLRRLTRGDEELSEDLVQETFKEATQHWHKLRDRTEKEREAWLISVACNTAVDVFRRGQTARNKRPQIRDLYSPAETDVHRQAMTSMAVQRLIEVITAMPPAQSRVAFLFWRCELSNHEIAQVLGISDSAVSQHLKKARELLVKELGAYLPSDPDIGEGR